MPQSKMSPAYIKRLTEKKSIWTGSNRRRRDDVAVVKIKFQMFVASACFNNIGRQQPPAVLFDHKPKAKTPQKEEHLKNRFDQLSDATLSGKGVCDRAVERLT